jgi:hypothetical protein
VSTTQNDERDQSLRIPARAFARELVESELDQIAGAGGTATSTRTPPEGNTSDHDQGYDIPW